MPAEISIVIPALNAAGGLQKSLPALMEGLRAGLIRELILSDGGSADATLDLAEEAGAVLVTGPASRGGQLKRGCAAAKGNWLLVLHADTVLGTGWADAAARHLEQGDGRPACFRLAFDAAGAAPAWVAGWANLRSRLFKLPYGDQGLLIRRRDYLAAGGYPDQPLMEDVALVRRLKGIILLPATARTSAARYQRDGWLRRGSRNLRILLRYALGADPEKLAACYRR